MSDLYADRMTAKQKLEQERAQRDQEDMQRRRAEEAYLAHRLEIDALQGLSAVGWSANLLKLYVNDPSDQFTTQLPTIQLKVALWCKERRWDTPVQVVAAKV